jgi:ferredoxin
VSATSGAVSPTAQGLSTAEDGTTYWGQLNNESARAKGRGETLVIDQWECISCGTCVENTDAVFTLPDDAKAVVVRQQGDMALIQDAIDACPVTCIHWTEEPNEFEQLNDADGKPA